MAPVITTRMSEVHSMAVVFHNKEPLLVIPGKTPSRVDAFNLITGDLKWRVTPDDMHVNFHAGIAANEFGHVFAKGKAGEFACARGMGSCWLGCRTIRARRFRDGVCCAGTKPHRALSCTKATLRLRAIRSVFARSITLVLPKNDQLEF